MDAPLVTHVETRYKTEDGWLMREIRPLSELTQLLAKITVERSELIGVRRLLLAAVLALLSAGNLSAQPAPPVKDPQTALLFSVILPGAGQIYADEIAKGWAMLIVAEGALIAGYATSQRGRCKNDDCTGPHWENLYIGAGVSIATWIYSMVDAPGAARRFNAKAIEKSRRVQPVASSNRIGVAVSW